MTGPPGRGPREIAPVGRQARHRRRPSAVGVPTAAAGAGRASVGRVCSHVAYTREAGGTRGRLDSIARCRRASQRRRCSGYSIVRRTDRWRWASLIGCLPGRNSRNRLSSWMSGARRSRSMIWVMRLREKPSARAMDA